MWTCDYIASFSFGDVAYVMYNTDSSISIASKYVCHVYAKELEKSHQKRHRTKIRSCVCGVHKQDTLFDDVEFQRRYHEKPFALGDACLTPLYQHVQYSF